MMENKKTDEPKLVLGDISTSWRRLHDPLKFVMTYGLAVRAYLLAILKDEHAAEEVLQDLLIQVTERGFQGVDPNRGRFRDYLKAVVRNAAIRYQRRRPNRFIEVTDLDQLAVAEADVEAKAWRDEWRRCVLDQAWRALDQYQRTAPGNLGYVVLRLTVDQPHANSKVLASQVTTRTGQLLTPGAFRKQLSRARRLFAEMIVAEVRQTLDYATDEKVREELAFLDLLVYLRDYLPD